MSRPSDNEIRQRSLLYDRSILGMDEDLPWVEGCPRGKCDAPLVFLFLYDLGCRNIQRVRADVSGLVRVNGQVKDNERHVWAEVDGLIVDLTAHQYDAHSAPVVTRKSEWHSGLQILEAKLWARGGLSEDEYFEDRMQMCGPIFQQVKVAMEHQQ